MSSRKIKIAIAGTGYIDLSNDVLLMQHHDVIALGTYAKKIEQLKNKISLISDTVIESFFKNQKINFSETLDKNLAYKDTDIVAIATSKEYYPETNCFNSSSGKSIINDDAEINPNTTKVIESIIHVVFTKYLKEKIENLISLLKLLSEDKAKYENLCISRMIARAKSARAEQFAQLLLDGDFKQGTPLLLTDSIEAEAIKLFSNTHLVIRVVYFNELDTYSQILSLNTKQIIEGAGMDTRIRNHYNKSLFGNGGYCQPRDTKRLRTNYQTESSNKVNSIVKSDRLEKTFFYDLFLQKIPKIDGIYRVIMKRGSDYFLASNMQA